MGWIASLDIGEPEDAFRIMDIGPVLIIGLAVLFFGGIALLGYFSKRRRPSVFHRISTKNNAPHDRST